MDKLLIEALGGLPSTDGIMLNSVTQVAQSDTCDGEQGATRLNKPLNSLSGSATLAAPLAISCQRKQPDVAAGSSAFVFCIDQPKDMKQVHTGKLFLLKLKFDRLRLLSKIRAKLHAAPLVARDTMADIPQSER
jgi:hypothetical protein